MKSDWNSSSFRKEWLASEDKASVHNPSDVGATLPVKMDAVKSDKVVLPQSQNTTESTIHSLPNTCNMSQNHQLNVMQKRRKVLLVPYIQVGLYYEIPVHVCT